MASGAKKKGTGTIDPVQIEREAPDLPWQWHLRRQYIHARDLLADAQAVAVTEGMLALVEGRSIAFFHPQRPAGLVDEYAGTPTLSRRPMSSRFRWAIRSTTLLFGDARVLSRAALPCIRSAL